MMYFLATFLVSLFFGLRVLAQTQTTLSYDDNYGNAALDLNSVSCSDGTNGIKTKYPQYQKLGDLPSFPNVTAVYTVEGYNSAQCGACYAVTYGNSLAYLLAVDKAQAGFTTSPAAMNFLTNGQAVSLGRVDVTFTQVATSECGLN